MRRWLLASALLLLLGAPTYAQLNLSGAPTQTTGSLVNNGDTVTANVAGMATVAVKLSIGTSCGGAGCQVFFEASVDGTNYTPVYGFVWKGTPQLGSSSYTFSPTFTTATSTQTPALAIISLPGGVTNFHVIRSNDGNSGTVAVTISPGSVAAVPPMMAVGPGTNSIGTVKVNDGTNTLTVKAASTAAVASDPSTVVGLSPNSPLPAGTNVIGGLSANQTVDQTRVNGVAVSVNTGAPDAGTQRVTLAQGVTYSAGTTAATATAAGTGIFFEICGSATKTVRVQKITVSGTAATGPKNGDVVITKHSAATTAGTATTLTQAPLDSNSAAGTATNVRFFTVLGTAGASVGVVGNGEVYLPLTGTGTFTQPVEFVWRDQDSEAPTLRGTTQCVTANFGATTTNAPSLLVYVKWTEQ